LVLECCRRRFVEEAIQIAAVLGYSKLERVFGEGGAFEAIRM
jgi:hypothetical protein